MPMEAYSIRTYTVFALLAVGVIMALASLAAGFTYHELSLTLRQSASTETIELQSNNLLRRLEEQTRDLALSIQRSSEFRDALTRRDTAQLEKYLNIQFHQYFVTADVIRLQKIYLYDEYLSFIVQSPEGLQVPAGEEICPGLITRAKRRHGPRRLQPIAEVCVYHEHPFHGIVVPIGGLKVSGYIAIISDPAWILRQIANDLGLPLHISLPNGENIYRSDNWPSATEEDATQLAQYTLHSSIFEPALNLTVAHALRPQDDELATAHLHVFAISAGALLLALLFSLVLLQSRVFLPLRRLHHQVTQGSPDRSTPLELPDTTGCGEIDDLVQAYSRLDGELRDARQVLQSLHFIDDLTELPNRSLFHDRLQQITFLSERNNGSFALLMMDLDRFREINETFGADCGDFLLQQVARRLSQELRKSDTVARLTDHDATRFGSDEFAIILPAIDNAQNAVIVAQKIQRLMEHPYSYADQAISLSMSIGIVIYPEHGTEPQTLLQRADIAMYQAKHQRQGFALYDTASENHSLSQLTMISDLRRAIEHSELHLVFQPKIQLKTLQLAGVEALVRWDHAQRGAIPLHSFIPLAEHTGLIKPLAKWVLAQAAQACVQLHQAGCQIHTAVNISVRNLFDSALPEVISAILDEFSLDSRWLHLELTESAIMSDSSNALRTLDALRQAGIRLVIDDFGTGQSSLATLKKLPVDEIKIDRSFILEMKQDNNDTAIVRSTIDLAHNMNLLVTAEGVDSAEIWRLLAAMGCDMAQGHYIAQAMPLPELLAWIANWRWGCVAGRDGQALQD